MGEIYLTALRIRQRIRLLIHNTWSSGHGVEGRLTVKDCLLASKADNGFTNIKQSLKLFVCFFIVFILSQICLLQYYEHLQNYQSSDKLFYTYVGV